VAWYRSLHAPRTGGAYDSHHRTAGVAGCTRRCSGRFAARGARAAGRRNAAHRILGLGHALSLEPLEPDTTTLARRDLVVALAARNRLPAVYPSRVFVDAGGLMAYGTYVVDGYRLSATYVDRILRGAKPADLPVQAPTKYESVLNLKTAKSLGIEVPPSLLVRADVVIE